LTAAPTGDSRGEAPGRGRRGVLRVALSVLVPIAVIAVFVYVIAGNSEQIGHAIKRTSLGQLALVTGLAFVTLIARTEAVVACLNAMGERPRRRDIHAANSLTFLAATINHYASSVVRGALMRRIDRERSPTIPQMVMVDTSTTLIEALIVGILIVASAGALKLDWWEPVAILVACVCGVAVALLVRRRFAHRELFRGLDVLVHSRQRVVVAVLMLIVIVTQVVRTLIVLRAVGLDPSLLQAVATFVTGGVLSSLFAGPGAGTAGGPLIVFGHTSLAASAAAGIELSITSLLAGVIYAVAGGPLFLWRLRQAYA
jgi:uncharacterized membrane protein YbhN (UPF0104 family)